MSTSNHIYRKCAKCRVNAVQDASVRLHRFPKPGTTNILRATAWATYCWPDQDWSSLKSLTCLYERSKVLCGRHFQDSFYTDSSRKRLSRYAVPGTKEYVTKTLHSLKTKMSVSSIVQQNNYLQAVEIEDESSMNGESPVPQSPIASPIESSVNEESPVPESPVASPIQLSSPPQHPRRRSSEDVINEASKPMKDSFNTIKNVLKNEKNEEDECDMYCKLLAKKLRALPKIERAFFMDEIDGMFMDRLRTQYQ